MSDTSETQDLPETHEAPANPDTRSAQDTPSEPAPSEADIAPPLTTLIAAIRSAVAPGASPEARATGATACRSILTVLDAKPGEPLAAAPASPTSPTSPIASLLSQPGLLSKLAAMSREQLLDLLKQVTGAMPTRPHTPTTAAPRFHLISIPQVRRPGGT
jgi:hypothetical protein